MLGVQAGFQRIIGSQAGGGVGSAQAAQGDGVIGSQGHTGGSLPCSRGRSAVRAYRVPLSPMVSARAAALLTSQAA